MSPAPADQPTTTGTAGGKPSGTSSTTNASATTTGFVQTNDSNVVMTRSSILSMLLLSLLFSLAIIIA
jgi:hypothetical protein